MFELLEELIKLPAIPGREDAVRRFIAETASPYADEFRADALGNLIIKKRGASDSPRTLMLCTQTDSPGFFVTFIEESGLLRIAPAGESDPAAVAYTPVVSGSGERAVRGILAPDAGVSAADLKVENFCIDIGAKDKKKAESIVGIGDFFIREPYLHKLCGSRITGSPLGCRIGCAVLIETLRTLGGCRDDVYFVFASDRGAGAAARSVMPDIALTVGAGRSGDEPGAKHSPIKLGAGVSVKVRGGSLVYSPELVKLLRETAEREGIAYQSDPSGDGAADAAAAGIMQAGEGCRAAVLSIPARYSRGGAELIGLGDADACVRLLTRVLMERE